MTEPTPSPAQSTPSPLPPQAAGSPSNIIYQPLPERSLLAILIPFIPIALALAVASGVWYYKSRHHSSPEMTTTGPHTLKIGSLAPDFSLPDAHKQSGDEPVTLSILADKSPVLVLFYLGYSCPRCVGHLQEISDRIEDFKKAGLQIIAISPDTLAETKDSITTYGDFHFPLLSDQDEKVARVFGLIEPDGGMHHAVFLIDTNRRIQFFNISDHPDTDIDGLLAMAANLQKAGTTKLAK
jgi:peroxiredoxin